MTPDRLDVRKTYKLYVGGEFLRSESGRSYEVRGHAGELSANAVRASRKDLRDAVRAARGAWPNWSALTAYNRGQVLYRVAEIMESRRAELAAEVGRAEGDAAVGQLDEAIDTWVWYAGLADKLAQVLGNMNEVAGPYFNITSPEPTGVVGIVAVPTPSLSGLVASVAPALCAGNVVVALASEPHPLPAVVLAECLATADVPAGVVNLLTGRADELVGWLASHADVDALDVSGVAEADRADVEAAAADNVKRVVAGDGAPDPYRAARLMEMKTVWHPKGR